MVSHPAEVPGGLSEPKIYSREKKQTQGKEGVAGDPTDLGGEREGDGCEHGSKSYAASDVTATWRSKEQVQAPSGRAGLETLQSQCHLQQMGVDIPSSLKTADLVWMDRSLASGS